MEEPPEGDPAGTDLSGGNETTATVRVTAPEEAGDSSAAATIVPEATATSVLPVDASSSSPSASAPSLPLSRVVQVTNIAPQATRDQMMSLFVHVGQVEDIRLYPSVRDASVSLNSRCCFVKFVDDGGVAIAQHLNNTVFIDRAIIVSVVPGGEIPDEYTGLAMAQQRPGGLGVSQQPAEVKMPPNMLNRIEGVAPNAKIMTHDPRLEVVGLPMYPPLPADTPTDKVEEIRRTVCVVGLDSTVSAQQCMEAFQEGAGEVKYFRYCTRPTDANKYALVEFTDHNSVVPALQMNDRQLGMSRIKVTHATQAIIKPTAKSNEAAQKEIEEAMNKVKETQSLVSAAVDPLMGILGAGAGNAALNAALAAAHVTKAVATSSSLAAAQAVADARSRSRSKSRTRERSRYSSRRSRTPDRYHSRRSRTPDRYHRRRRSRSRSRSRDRRSRSRDRRRRRSRSRERKRRKRSNNLISIKHV